MWIKIVTNFLMGFKIWSQVGELENDFQNYPMYVCFFIFILKVVYFNSICQLKSAFFFRIIFILKVMYFKNTCDHRPFWTSEVTLVLHVLSSTSPFLSLWGPAEALHPPSAEGASFCDIRTEIRFYQIRSGYYLKEALKFFPGNTIIC